jgi:hypothetical protein
MDAFSLRRVCALTQSRRAVLWRFDLPQIRLRHSGAKVTAPGGGQ